MRTLRVIQKKSHKNRAEQISNKLKMPFHWLIELTIYYNKPIHIQEMQNQQQEKTYPLRINNHKRISQ